MDRKKMLQMVSDVKTAVGQLESAMGQDRYEDGDAMGNPVQEYDDPDVDLGNKDGGLKRQSFVARMKKKLSVE